MTTWTMEQVSVAERLRASLVVDDATLARDPDSVRIYAEDELAKRLISMAHPFAIELHREDFEAIWERSDATPWQVTGRMRWHPNTNTVELRGGHLDGQRYAVQHVGEPLKIPRPAATPFWDASEEDSSASLVELTDIYELAGWRERERVWLYKAH